ncbi:MAG: CRISPR-associated helicase/endonuclease Cas3 [Anaerolineae bacterium CG17_big_fil_post_rev_8_21_14_2_50_57_27]|nr:MAG: CRISPR-associated helicase/endonuclease Cas3 [Anaerolineae bacterium CG06_land_8_20_14_3_00_57_67]PIW19830.1 MAG: CRISPR-associated helicase/endonuclease Cas3 [Anaerolineae bacterium CG17_big_fil_post_rev_8_21_14_2_50_57_27]
MELYPYQKRVAKLLRAGKSVVLQAPTGSGKTIAAIWPYLESWDRQATDFPRKCIYVVPMRVLAHQFVESTIKLVKQDMVLSSIPDVKIQTGDQPEDRRFEGDLIFCTIDQFLSSYLTMPYGLPNRLANLNAGAGVGSYLVFDEFHLLDPESTLPSAWYVIKQLSKLAPVLLMTATFSKTMLDMLAEELNATVETVSPEEARKIEGRIQTPVLRQRVWETAKSGLSSEAVLNAHQSRSLVLCNTVRTAQRIYREIKQKIDADNSPIQLLLLHSRFLTEDRHRIEAELRRLFGKGDGCDGSGSVIAIATQTIEVGVDITSEILHTELAPASSIIQRAGRCARYPGEQGKVIVYPVEKFTPYATDKDGKAWKDEMQAAFQWLQAHSGEAFDFDKEQEFVNAVATPRDQRVLAGLFAGETSRKEDISRVLGGDQQAAGRLLIRNADSFRILIHPEPDELLENPKSASGFNLQPATLYGVFKDWQNRADELGLDWIAKRLIEDYEHADRDEDNRTDYDWKLITDSSVLTSTRLVVVNPALAGYDPNEGFLPDRGDTSFISTLPENAAAQTWEGYSYSLESYEEHIQRVLTAFETVILPELEYPALVLEKAANWQSGSLLEAARLICLLHDVGKLSKGWQAWARAHQQAVGKPIPASFAAAHTDTDRKNLDLQAAAKEAARRNPKPHHAAEGALAVAPIFFNALPKELAQAAITAITRHHTPFTREKNQRYNLETLAGKHVAETVGFVPTETRRKINPAQMKTNQPPNPSFPQLLVNPSQEFGWLAYTLLVRALRRADQTGTSYSTR